MYVILSTNVSDSSTNVRFVSTNDFQSFLLMGAQARTAPMSRIRYVRLTPVAGIIASLIPAQVDGGYQIRAWAGFPSVAGPSGYPRKLGGL